MKIIKKIKSRYYLLVSFISFFIYIIVGCSVYKCNFKLYDKSLPKYDIVTIKIDKNSRMGIYSRIGIWSDIDIIGIDNKDCLCEDKIRIDPGMHTLRFKIYEKAPSKLFKEFFFKILSNYTLTANFKKAHSYLLKYEEKESVIVDFPGEDATFYKLRIWIEDSITGEVISEILFNPPVKVL